MAGRKKNCWEVKACGREPGGLNALGQGVCPAASEHRLDGVHGGTASGRACWVVAGTQCSGKVQGTFAMKLSNCLRCAFYQRVRTEEGPAFRASQTLLDALTPEPSERASARPASRAAATPRARSGRCPTCGGPVR